MYYLTELEPQIRNHHATFTGNFPFISDVEKYVESKKITMYQIQKPGVAGYESVGIFRKEYDLIENQACSG